jgi:uroporphyrinogen-III synthase
MLRRILVTRAAPGAEATGRRIAARGLTPILAPLLAIAPSTRDASTTARALAFTSANGARMFAALNSRRDLPVFAVGDATAATARALGFHTVLSAQGDMGALAALLQAQLPPGASVFHPTGRDQAGDLAAAAPGLKIESRAIYRAEAARLLPVAALAALVPDPPQVDAVMAHSPRAASVFVRLLTEAGLGARRADLTGLAISARAAAALEPEAWREMRVARTPDEEALLALLD